MDRGVPTVRQTMCMAFWPPAVIKTSPIAHCLFPPSSKKATHCPLHNAHTGDLYTYINYSKGLFTLLFHKQTSY